MTVNDGRSVLRDVAIRALTYAAQPHPDGSPADFAGFLADVLAAVAANLGGTDQLIAGRPGSWNARRLEGLLEGTMGDDPDRWPEQRTEPVMVAATVAQLVGDAPLHPGLLGLDDALAPVDQRNGNRADDGYDPDLHARDRQATPDRRDTDTYRDDPERFTTLVPTDAATIKLTVQVEFRVDADAPTRTVPSTVHNPYWTECEPVASEPCEHTHNIVALPNVRTGRPVSSLRRGSSIDQRDGG